MNLQERFSGGMLDQRLGSRGCFLPVAANQTLRVWVFSMERASLNGEDGGEGWFWWALIRSGAVLSFLTCVSPEVSLLPLLHQFVFQHVVKELMFEDVSPWISSRIRSDPWNSLKMLGKNRVFTITIYPHPSKVTFLQFLALTIE